MSLRESVVTALAAQPQGEQDSAVAELALTYATAIDQGEGELTKLGPPLLNTLEALRLSPRARTAAMKGGSGDDDSPASPLDELRQRRRTRANRAAAVDAATP